MYSSENKYTVRLACVKHAASVHPEPGSNSHKKFILGQTNVNVYLPVFTVSRFVPILNFLKNFQGWSILFSCQGSLAAAVLATA